MTMPRSFSTNGHVLPQQELGPLLSCDPGQHHNRNDAWFVYQLEAATKMRVGDPPLSQYNESDLLYDHGQLPRNFASEWDDWEYDTYSAQVKGFFVAMQPGGHSRVCVCT